MRKKNDRVSEGSDSFALFGDSVGVPTGAVVADTHNTDKKKVQQAHKAEQDRTQPADEKPDAPEREPEKIRHKAKRGFRALENNKDSDHTASDSDAAEGSSGSAADGKGGRAGGEQQRSDQQNKGSVKRTRRTKQKVSASKGGTGVQEDDDSAGETLDYSAYKLKEFDYTNKIQNYAITGKPRKTNDDQVVEVIIDGYRYRVSAWSIRGGQYIQGLDSKFLVSKYKVGRR